MNARTELTPRGVSRRNLLIGAAAGGVLAAFAPSAAGFAARLAPGQISPVTAVPPILHPGTRTLALSDSFGPISGWQRQGVIMSRDQPWETDLLQDPTIVYNSGAGALFKCWYGSLHGVGYATSDDGVTWTKLSTPVISPSLESELGYLNQPSVVLHDGVWHMAYFGMSASGTGRIHYATASRPDGPWQKHGVILAPTQSWEDDFLYNSALMYDPKARVWKMWFTAGKIASAGGEPEFICHATAPSAAGPWTKHAQNPLVRPMDDGGWASLGVGGPNVRVLADGTYESRLIGWQADHPSRGGKMTSPDGITWSYDRSSLDLDLGVVGGPEDSMIYRSFVVAHQGVDYLYYNVKNNRPGWNETIHLAKWAASLNIVNPAKWTMTHATRVPNGASFEVSDNRLRSLGNAPDDSPQALQGNALIPGADYSISATVTPTSSRTEGRDTVLQARATTRDRMYYAGISSWGRKYAIGVITPGGNMMLAGAGSAQEIVAGVPHRLRFAVDGDTLRLFDNDELVVSATDATHRPASSYVGLQSSYGFGTATFEDVQVRLLGGVQDTFAIDAKASTRCIADKIQVIVSVRNADTVPVNVTLRTPYGVRDLGTLQPGRTISKAFSSRQSEVADGVATAIVTGTIDAVAVRTDVAIAFPALSC